MHTEIIRSLLIEERNIFDHLLVNVFNCFKHNDIQQFYNQLLSDLRISKFFTLEYHEECGLMITLKETSKYAIHIYLSENEYMYLHFQYNNKENLQATKFFDSLSGIISRINETYRVNESPLNWFMQEDICSIG